jgi:antitoxin component of MazEF toxin-antitoxin module
MFKFGTRKVTRQGGSFLISLPMQWMQDIGIDMELVNVEMDTDKSLRIAPAHPAKNDAGTASHYIGASNE